VRRPKCVKAVNDAVEYLSKGKFRFCDYPTFADIGNVRFLLLNTSAPSNLLCSWGFVKKSDAAKIAEFCREKKSDQVNILLSHYPMYEDHPILRMRHRLFGQQELLKLIEAGSIDLSLCGHVHKPYLQRDASGRPLEECAGSVTRNGSMVEITLENSSFDFRTIGL
jgi:Icc-related predicted phosphoesterase